MHDVDSLLPVKSKYHPERSSLSELRDAEEDFSRTRDARKAMVTLCRIAKVPRYVADGRGRYKLFSGLARLSSRLKLYPLAMKFYRKANVITLRANFSPVDSSLVDPSPADSSLIASSLPDDLPDYLLPDTNAAGIAVATGVWTPVPIHVTDLLTAFDDGRDATDFAMIVHIKQPIRGRRKAFTHINNVGHTFITLIKYNADHSIVSRSFGFYPHKKGFLSATPFHVKAPSDFKDDGLHEWDESVGKFISAGRFHRVLALLSQYDHMIYNLNNNNCTDFGLQAAAIGGIRIMETRGRWPLGRGNNPANAGQSVLEGKVENIDPAYGYPLFVHNQ